MFRLGGQVGAVGVPRFVVLHQPCLHCCIVVSLAVPRSTYHRSKPVCLCLVLSPDSVLVCQRQPMVLASREVGGAPLAAVWCAHLCSLPDNLVVVLVWKALAMSETSWLCMWPSRPARLACLAFIRRRQSMPSFQCSFFLKKCGGHVLADASVLYHLDSR